MPILSRAFLGLDGSWQHDVDTAGVLYGSGFAQETAFSGRLLCESAVRQPSGWK